MSENSELSILPVVLAGGVGSRLWPLSRAQYPKQFQDLLGSGESFFQATLSRLNGLENTSSPIVVCNESHRFLVAEQLRVMGQAAAILLEPSGKNTAPAIALAAHHILANGKDDIMLVMPADHVIEDHELFHQALRTGYELACKDMLVTFGVTPTAPETGYGYICKGPALNQSSYRIESFKEKPDLEQAQAYLESGEYFWNAGLFMFRASIFLQQLGLHAADINDIIALAYGKATQDKDFYRVDERLFESCRADSIDYAVMEKTESSAVVALPAKWSDVGAWSALWEVSDHDANGNSVRGDVILEQTSNTLVYAESRLVAAIGLEDFMVVETADAVLIAPQKLAQNVKHVVASLSQSQRNEADTHTQVYRPWGWYETICLSERFQVKRIMVNPGASLSLQLHHHRAEHWVVVKGTAEVTRDEEVILLSEDQSTYIPLGKKHRLTNKGVIPLEIIEIQTGSYLGEDDIVRFDDVYGRSGDK